MKKLKGIFAKKITILIYKGGYFSMQKNQKINCTVTSCKYNDEGCQECKLEQIIVTPIVGCNTKQSDESMCSSYRNNNNK